MKNLLLIIFVVITSCTFENKEKNISFLSNSTPIQDWEIYEGKWLAKDGVIRLELYLSKSSNKYDLYYKLYESFESKTNSNGAVSEGEYIFYDGMPDNELRIRLRKLAGDSHEIHFRIKNPLDSSEEMFFLTRGQNELIPTDENFKPLTLDKRYTLHKRLDYFTVEGYITFLDDTAQYFEKNTSQYWKLADVGEFDSLKILYKKLTKEKYEGLYLKALAYTISDTTTKSEKALVIKKIKSVGDELAVTKTK